MLDILNVLISAGVILFIGWVIVEAWKDLQIQQEEWKERVAKKKQAKLDFEDAKLNAGIKRGEE
jgi:hypothetical protein